MTDEEDFYEVWRTARCARCGRVLKHWRDIDGLLYGRVCFEKMWLKPKTYHTERVPVIGGTAQFGGRTWMVPPGVREVIVAVLDK